MAISLNGHFIKWSFHQMVISSNGYFIKWSFHQMVISSKNHSNHCHFVNVQLFQMIILSYDHDIHLSFHLMSCEMISPIVILSKCHSVKCRLVNWSFCKLTCSQLISLSKDHLYYIIRGILSNVILSNGILEKIETWELLVEVKSLAKRSVD